MAVLLTGASGYLGAYIAAELLATTSERLALIVRADSLTAAQQRLWRALQLHMSFDQFLDYRDRIDIYPGDITLVDYGLSTADRAHLVDSCDSIIHAAAAVNRKSLHACVNANIRGTLETIRLARAIQQYHSLRRFSLVSSVAVAAGLGHHRVIHEHETWQWQQRVEDPYVLSKRLAEQLLQELLPDVDSIVLRPSAIIGDSRFAATTQFEAARALVCLAKTRIVPIPRHWRIDIVPADYVARAIVALHQKPQLQHPVYHLSAGVDSPSYADIVANLRRSGVGSNVIFAPTIQRPLIALIKMLSMLPRPRRLAYTASLMKAFLPFLLADNVFKNTRVSGELNIRPTPFGDYAAGFYRFVVAHRFRYPYQAWPAARFSSC